MRRKCKAQSGQAGYVNTVTHEALSSSADRLERRLIRKSELFTSIGRPCFGFASLLNWTNYSTSGALVTQFGAWNICVAHNRHVLKAQQTPHLRAQKFRYNTALQGERKLNNPSFR
uniref:Uncharacterized protein n=1 Tax=Pyricularia oryzae (strain P131) TaxID=1143193 RepID=L7IPM0_PYRO1